MREPNVGLRCWLCAAVAAAVFHGGSARFVRGAAHGRSAERLQEGSPIMIRNASSGGHVSHTLKLENYLGVQYIAPISLGQQTLGAVYDTGSFDIMAVATSCAVCKWKGQAYNQGTSGSFSPGPGRQENHVYVSGRVTAKQDYELVHIGDVSSPLVSQRTPFWQVMDTDINVWTEQEARFTAIVGLGHADQVPDQDGRPSGALSLLARVSTDRFAICLERGPENPGWLTFNPPMPAVLSSVYRTVPVVGENHWATPLVGFTVEGWTGNLATGRNAAIVDSGTSMMGVPSSVIWEMDGLLDHIDSDCNNLEDLPDLIMKIGQHTFTLPPSAYVLKVSSTISDGTTFRTCIPAFMAVDMETPEGQVWILGMPFLRSHYTVFDRAAKQLHIADQGQGCQPVKEEFQMFGFLNPDGLAKPTAKGKGKGKRKLPSEPTKADLKAAMRPMWARGRNATLLRL